MSDDVLLLEELMIMIMTLISSVKRMMTDGDVAAQVDGAVEDAGCSADDDDHDDHDGDGADDSSGHWWWYTMVVRCRWVTALRPTMKRRRNPKP